MKQYPGYTLVKHEDCPEQHGTLTVLTHDVSGAAVLLVENDDDNKAFGIGFGTFPSDDTGVFHILEHSVLAGSEKYPVKSPFLQLLKSSMASFLNAMTFPDKTVYPFATPNETDFKNLMDVYLNAVFCPLAMVDKGVFEQEGWHRDEDGTVSGVVYNEMQGALATPDAQLQNALSRAMFPDTAYGFVSGGDPASIPALTYEKYVRVYRRHYSADNCCITLYGKMDMAEKLAFLDEQYLSRMPKSASRPRLTVQDEQVGAKRNIPYYTEKPEPDEAQCALAWYTGAFSDRERQLGVEILLDALLGTNQAPLKAALLEEKLGADIDVGFDDSTLQPTLELVLRGATEESAGKFAAAVRKAVDGILEKGIPEELLMASLNSTEFASLERPGSIPDGVLDAIKDLGYHYSTRGSLTVAIADMTVPQKKYELIGDTEKEIIKIDRQYRRGLITNEERSSAVIKAWEDCTNKVSHELTSNFDGAHNPIHMMVDSGARGSTSQLRQLAGMRGLMADTSGRTIEIPIKANFREGLSVLEYFISSRGARKGMADTALRTADSGYLTRRLVDVSQDLIIREIDCAEGKDEIPGMWVSEFTDGKEQIESLQDRITGRFSCETIKDKDGNVIVKANHMITPKRAARVIKDGINENGEHYTKVKIRTILTCRSGNGICAKCYGANMATGEAVQVGESVGIIAAQSIGEPGTQLTMRTFHTGGVAGGDITQGLPRVEELFEARKPKGLAIITEIAGVAQIKDTKKKREIVVTNPEDGVSKTYLIPYGSRIKIADGTVLEAGDELTEGSVNPHDILKIKGVRAVQDYMIREVQRVYRLQGVEINDKHIEVIVRQMLKKIRIEENGDTEFLPGDMVDFLDYDETNKALIAEGKEPAEGKQVLLGITKASLASDSFLSAASFQETTKVLTDAAIKGKVDHLVGLKENVIIGKPIPAGTGMKCYSNIHLNTDSMIEEEEDEDLILTEDLEDDAPAAPMAEAPVEEPSAEEEEPMLDFDFEEMIPSKDDTEE